jgi:hypothetical protein
MALCGCLVASLAGTSRAGDSLITAFTYQGQLHADFVPVNGLVDFEFRLYYLEKEGELVAPPVVLEDVEVVHGLFTVQLDFGPDSLDGVVRWLEILVRDSGEKKPDEFTLLTPRQPLGATPYALKVPGLDGHSLDAVDGSPANALYVNQVGNVGIGTFNPDGGLHVRKEPNTLGGTLALEGTTHAYMSFYPDGAAAGRKGRFGFISGEDNVMTIANTDTNGHIALFPGISGFVGIGVTIPSVRLHVLGGSDASPISGGFLQLGSTTGSNLAFDENEIMARLNTTPANLFLNHEGASIFMCAAAGSTSRVGIGLTNPQTRLQVVGGIRARGGGPGAFGVNDNGYAFGGNGGDDDSGLFSLADGRVALYANAVERVRVTQSAFQVFSLSNIGDHNNVQWRAADGLFGYDNSTRRDKENIQPLDASFDRLLDAVPMTYTRPGSPDRWEIGFIAEDMHDLGLTRLVQYDAQGRPEAVNYEKSTLYLVAIAKQQKVRLAELEERLAIVERSLLALANRMADADAPATAETAPVRIPGNSP